jgi:hypothetical protein
MRSSSLRYQLVVLMCLPVPWSSLWLPVLGSPELMEATGCDDLSPHPRTVWPVDEAEAVLSWLLTPDAGASVCELLVRAGDATAGARSVAAPAGVVVGPVLS